MLPIFPLSTVLFPGGSLPLRIFEPRYMDMIKACLSQGSRFGVCLITQGHEVGAPAVHEAEGCEAEVREWDMAQLGILQVRVLGLRRFRIQSSQVRSNGLIEAEVDYLPDEVELPLPVEHAALAKLMQRICEELEAGDGPSILRRVETPGQFASANWVGQRLCECLPLPLPIKQRLMMLDDPLGRLQVLQHFLKQQGVL